MRVLITGGAGFIANHLASALLKTNAEVCLLDNFNDFYDPEIKRQNVRDLQSKGNAPMHIVDILDREKLRHVFEETRPEAIVHLAAWAGVRPSIEKPELYSSVNITGTVTLELARNSQCFILDPLLPFMAETPAPFGKRSVDRPVSPMRRPSVPRALHTYYHNFSMHITCLRFFTVYGPRQRPEMAIHKFAQLCPMENSNFRQGRLKTGLHLCRRHRLWNTRSD
jgi:UDP-glucuronate 4-epimerase